MNRPAPRAGIELPPLTGLRAVAALWVASVHSQMLLGGSLWPAVRGYLGVDLFFVLSGFILTHVYGQAMGAPSWPAVRRFYLLRLGRIWPGYIVAHAAMVGWLMFVSLAGSRHLPPLDGAFWRDAAVHGLMLQSWGLATPLDFGIAAWSVSAEIVGYILFPALAFGLARLAPRQMAVALLPAFALVLLAAAIKGWQLHATVGSPGILRLLGEFCMGMLLYRLSTGPAAARWPWDRLALALLAVIVAAVALSRPYGGFDFPLVVALALLVPALAWSRGWAFRLFTHRLMLWLGEISYGVFLMHFIVFVVISAVTAKLGWLYPAGAWQPYAFFAFGMIASVAAGAALFYAVERPARAWVRRRLASRP